MNFIFTVCVYEESKLVSFINGSLWGFVTSNFYHISVLSLSLSLSSKLVARVKLK